ncbi:MAG TPA: xanthine dehydrogenase molybdopterin binding subunit [Geminicoccaceae bacterium]|nr:xanthine dehydrogenase molybdopterin binding subunit [Geminicoccus sp.]HMU48404.1 xanthine dehydrogenase molybdopterin binding subunit [Geminicoccaceae bacterium]
MSERIKGGVAEALAHDSAAKHVSGEAVYIDDIPEPARTLQIHIGQSARAHARLVKVDVSKVRTAPGVAVVLTAEDIPGINDISAVHAHDEPVLAVDKVMFVGQAIFAVAAETIEQARRAAKLADILYEDLEPVLDIDTARAAEDFVWPPGRMRRGDAKAAIQAAPRRLEGRIVLGGQEHFYLEGQVSLAVPGEDGDVTIHCSTQHPSEGQLLVSHVLGVPSHAVIIETRRMGGGFGGKETHANLYAALAAIVATKTGRAAKCRLDRDDDMIMTGKRHDFVVDYEVGFDEDGRIRGVDMQFASNCGWNADLSGPVNDRALFHADNCYWYPDVALVCYPCRTNKVSNTAYRGFGGPQGMVPAERIIEEVAFAVGKDPLEIRKLNFYGKTENNITPYHQTVEDNVIHEIVADLERTADYAGRRAGIAAFNEASPWLKRGIALTPVKFGISFTMTAYNQAGALLHIYRDGSVYLNHGGTEMGQGLFMKVAQVVAEELQIDVARVKISATNTSKVPNTSATAASSGSDLNGMAAQAAARTLKDRLTGFAAERFQAEAGEVQWLPGRIRVRGEEVPFDKLVHDAYFGRVQLSATGFYATPKIHWSRDEGRGRPFYYYAYGAACSEVTIDTLTGEYRLDRVDILHDVGRSLNPAIDLGQIEGAFVQGAGWLTMEELWWDEAGRLRTHAPSTYKIPACSDRPKVLNIRLFDNANAEPTIYRSKAVGEPPFMLGISALHAISDAVASVADHKICPRIDPPATPEKVLAAVERLRAQAVPAQAA